MLLDRIDKSRKIKIQQVLTEMTSATASSSSSSSSSSAAPKQEASVAAPKEEANTTVESDFFKSVYDTVIKYIANIDQRKYDSLFVLEADIFWDLY